MELHFPERNYGVESIKRFAASQNVMPYIVIGRLQKEKNMKDKYYDQAVACVKDYVLPAQLELYQSCEGDLDKIYGEAMNGTR